MSAVAMRETKEALESVSSSLEILQEGTIKLKTSLSDERASLSNTLSDPACTNGAVSHTCNTIRSTVPQLGASADFTKVLRTTCYSKCNSALILLTCWFCCCVFFCPSASRHQSRCGQCQQRPGNRPQQRRAEGLIWSPYHSACFHRCSTLFTSNQVRVVKFESLCSCLSCVSLSRVTHPSMTHQDSLKIKLKTLWQVIMFKVHVCDNQFFSIFLIFSQLWLLSFFRLSSFTC